MCAGRRSPHAIQPLDPRRRHTDRLAEVVAFYRDGLGQREAGRLEDHDGFRVAPEASIGEDLPRGDGLADDA